MQFIITLTKRICVYKNFDINFLRNCMNDAKDIIYSFPFYFSLIKKEELYQNIEMSKKQLDILKRCIPDLLLIINILRTISYSLNDEDKEALEYIERLPSKKTYDKISTLPILQDKETRINWNNLASFSDVIYKLQELYNTSL